MTVRRLLAGKSGNVSVIPPDARVQDVINQLEADDVSALVVSSNGTNILGIISPGDIVRGLKTFGRDAVDRPLGDLMTRDVISCDIGEPMSRIYELMDLHQIRHVPITQNGGLCGIINMLDVVKYRLDEIKAEAEAMKDYIVGSPALARRDR
jgi:CBS domain-containing protein